MSRPSLDFFSQAKACTADDLEVVAASTDLGTNQCFFFVPICSARKGRKASTATMGYGGRDMWLTYTTRWVSNAMICGSDTALYPSRRQGGLAHHQICCPGSRNLLSQ